MKGIITFQLREIQKEQSDNKEPNVYGFKKIKILAFNYNGQGSGLALQDGELAYWHKEDLFHMMFDGWYDLVK